MMIPQKIQKLISGDGQNGQNSKKTAYKTFSKKLLVFFFLALRFTQLAKQHLQKHFVLYFRLCSFVFKLLKKTTKDKYTKTCYVARYYCCAVST